MRFRGGVSEHPTTLFFQPMQALVLVQKRKARSFCRACRIRFNRCPSFFSPDHELSDETHRFFVRMRLQQVWDPLSTPAVPVPSTLLNFTESGCRQSTPSILLPYPDQSPMAMMARPQTHKQELPPTTTSSTSLPKYKYHDAYVASQPRAARAHRRLVGGPL